jgi:hypothetical protein
MSQIDVLRGSFRGVEFYVDSCTTLIGRKQVVHEYPFSNENYIEDMGQQPTEFTLQIRIAGSDYEKKRDAFVEAMKRPGRGTLIHPLYGSFEAFAMQSTLEENFSSMGFAEISVTFKVARVTQNLVESKANTVLLAQAAAQVYNNASTLVQSTFTPQLAAPFYFGKTAAFLSSLVSTMIAATSSFSISSALYAFTKQPVFLFLDTALGLANWFVSYFSLINSQTFSKQYIFDVNIRLANVGSQEVFVANTLDYGTYAQNTTLLTYVQQTMAFANIVELITDFPFQTTEDLDLYLFEMDKLYDKIEGTSIDDDLLADVQEARLQAFRYADSLRLNLYKIQELELQPIPVTVLAYTYYSNLDLVDALQSVNQNYDPSTISGNVRVFA